jgi:hypothetical protein
MEWVARYTTPANVQLVTRDATASEDSVISVHTDDIEGAYEAQKLGYEIVHPLTTEPWGVRRFFVRAPEHQKAKNRVHARSVPAAHQRAGEGGQVGLGRAVEVEAVQQVPGRGDLAVRLGQGPLPAAGLLDQLG